MTGLLGGIISLSAGVRDGAAWVPPNLLAQVNVGTCSVTFSSDNGGASFVSLYNTLAFAYVADSGFTTSGPLTFSVRDMAADLSICNLSLITDVSEIITGTNFSTATLISLTFTAVIDDGITISSLTSGGPVTGNGSTAYDFTFSISGPATGAPTYTATVVPVVLNTAPVISSNGGNSTAAIDVAENQTTVTDVQTTDDNDSEGAGLTYAITGGADQALFDIVAGTGILTFKTAPDKETPSDVGTDNIYDVQVTVTDSSALTDVQDIAVTVTDVTEGPTAEETQKVVSTFMNNRANHVLSHQPDIIGFVDGSNLNGGGPLGNLGLNANGGGVNLGFSTSRSRILAAQNQPESQNQGQNLTENTASSNDNIQLALASEGEETEQAGYGYGNAADSRAGTFDVWTELYGSKTNAGASDSSYWVGYVGGHYFINEQTLVGVVGQYDWSEESNSSVNSNANGQGWMIGPYLAGQLPDQKLYYEARASWGQSSNKVSPNGTYTDAFDTTRWLVNAKISGSYALDHLIVKPAISVSYYEETQKAYTDTNANVIPEQTISIGELKFGPTLTNNIKLDNGMLFQPSFGVNGVYNFAIKDNVASQVAALGNNDLRARIDAGFNLVDQDKGRLISTSVFYDGIGINDYQSYGGKVRLTLSFN